MKTRTFARTVTVALALGLVLTIGLAVPTREALADGTTVTYTGQGFNFDGTTYSLNDERCGVGVQTPADDGSTGQFANWNGSGQPYQTGQGYLVWVLTANGASSAHLYGGPFGAHPGVQMFKVGGTFKFASQYYDPTTLFPNLVKADYVGTVRGNVQLTVSHGCAPLTTQGTWCSPGFWQGTLKFNPNAWTTIGVDPSATMFNSSVYDDFYGALLSPDVSLLTVLTTTGGTYKGPGVAGTDPRTQPPNPALNPFNAVGAWATDQIPGFAFDPDLAAAGDDTSCPLDAHGNFK